ncbi:MAG: AMP-binding protein [Deltaproteobacteria bacterium]|nr:AMP-binding protein [Deltaproteobacteria bacterium]
MRAEPPTLPPTIPGLLERRLADTPDATAYFTRNAAHDWRATSWRDFADAVGSVAGGLTGLGLRCGDRLAVLAPTSLEWDVCQHAALQLGACVVGIDPHYPAELADTLVAQLAPTVLVAGDPRLLERIRPETRGRLRALVLFEGAASDCTPFGTLAAGPTAPPAVCTADDPALVAFSSGTSGLPKAVTYTHRQVVLACEAILDRFSDLEAGSTLVCWLPLANLFQRMINFCAMARGGTSYVVGDPRAAVDVARVAHPQVFVAVPRFLEKLWDGMRAKLAEAPRPLRLLVERALATALLLLRLEQRGERVPFTLRLAVAASRRTVLRPLRNVLGPRLRYFVSGSAPCPLGILERFAALGLPIYEAYGQSENVVPIAAGAPGAAVAGSVGRPMRSNDVRLADDGEVQVKGPGVFDPAVADNARHRSSLTADGYLATGDLGEWLPGGFLRLTGRKAELWKAPNGRWVAPAPIEGALRQVPGVEQAAVLLRGAVVGVLVLDRPAPAPDRLRAELLRALGEFPPGTRPQGLLLTTRPFTIEGGELTSNLKLRRDVVERRHAAELDALRDRLTPTTELELVGP